MGDMLERVRSAVHDAYEDGPKANLTGGAMAYPASVLGKLFGADVMISAHARDGQFLIGQDEHGASKVIVSHGDYDRIMAEITTEYALSKPIDRADAMQNLGLKPEPKELIVGMNGWELWASDDVPRDCFYVDPAEQRTYIAPETYETLTFSFEAMEEFTDDMERGAGMKRLVNDAGPYREAALAEAKAKGLDKPAVKDLLEALEEEASGLVVQAASLNRKPTPMQVETFALRLQSLRERVDAAKAKVADIEGLVGLAEVAVIDCLDNE